MRQPDSKMFQTPTKIRSPIETLENLEIIFSPQKIIHPDLYDQVLGQSLSHSQPFFSERSYKINDQYDISHFQTYSSQSEDSESIQTPSQKKWQTVKKINGLNKQLKETKNITLIKSNKKGCNCDKSKCQKQYCICLKNGDTCSSDCQCIDCENTKITSQHENNKKKALQILEDTIHKGCNCKNSNCKKGYCFCHSNGRKCSKQCKCLDCFNNQNSKEDQDQQNKNCGLTTKKKIKIDEFYCLENKENFTVNQ